MASSLTLLSNEQKELGSLVIDFGGGTTEYVVYCDGIIKHTGVLALGGDHVSHDLAIGLKIPMGRAEQLKIEHGSAILDASAKGKTISVAGDFAQSGKTINLEHLRQIMSLRIEEIFQIIEQDLAQAGLLDYVNAGVFICGGGARIPQIQTLAQKVFQLPTSLGKASSINGLTSALDQPEFATAIGLAKFGSLQQKRRNGGGLLAGGIKTISEMFRGKN
jgi:cell division protein FtsA